MPRLQLPACDAARRNARRLFLGSIRLILSPFALLVVSLVAASAPRARAAEISEFEVKAAALVNIVGFVEWPATAFANPEAPLVIGVLGRDRVVSLLEDLAATEKSHGRRIALEHYATPAEARSCHVLYVAQTAHARWPGMRSQFVGRPVLTVSDAPNFARQSGIVQFAIERNKLRLIVNLGAARLAGLTISSKVLRLADVVGDSAR